MTGRHGDDGFTLVELLLSVAILMIIMGALTGALITFLKNGTYTIERDDHSGGAAVLSSYLNRDFASTDAALAVPGSACSLTPSTTNAFTFTWTEWTASAASPTPVAGSQWRASYLIGDDAPAVGGAKRYTLSRLLCRPDGTTDRSVILRNLKSTAAVTAPVDAARRATVEIPAPTADANCPGGRLVVKLPTYVDDVSTQGYSFTGCSKGRTR